METSADTRAGDSLSPPAYTAELARLRAENDKLRKWVKEVHGALSQAKKGGAPAAAAPPAAASPTAATPAPSRIRGGRGARTLDGETAGMERRLVRTPRRVIPPVAPTPDELDQLEAAFERGANSAQREFEMLLARCRDQQQLIDAQATEIAELKARLRALRRGAQTGAPATSTDVPSGPPLPSRHGPERPSQLIGSLRTLNKRGPAPTE